MKTITKAQLVELVKPLRFDVEGQEENFDEIIHSDFDYVIQVGEYPVGDDLIRLLKLLDIEVTE
tara:strand:+ start:4346 stop:4537 length:192 start_codon:yes stop_codon:yes gene_type:complete